MTCIYLAESAQTSANELAHTFDLTIACQLPDSSEYLYADSDGISLCRAGEKGRVQVDFVGGAAQYRRTKGGGELIAKAVNHTSKPTIWDGTGGLGRDSFVLASLGLTVQTFEQHPAVACLLHDGLNRALQHPDTAEIARRITLHFGDTATLMPQLAQQIGRPDVVYLDPMYPERQKSAAVKKEMAYFHGLVGTAQDEAALLNTARAIAKKRVVVKRPRLGEFLNGEKPAYQYSGKSTRFDAYVPNSPTQE
ncbi:16S rRNA methyltransferase [Neisseria sp. N95_16]|uniref:Ribosomal RNA small subunit methyltransferase J n=1 Tax=Neisseria brasiliensis TaxID=2666100 RepID=A0A5Q3RZH8_9NEIS|nr:MULTISPECIES: class I SAM-dependent methyltransferase [Neisseria]MRN38346.1 16S rRNA methyltransferase [Neisseria brasiliensis]PJO10246.1 16S rRNA methyltransferase [Neisseria sp. N95_16]PJO77640.1 16S rRNA methyltransferase [Neisseria sp. N177_16]QGL25347.1 16S rRNA methyltransferase [Neisseria brasiliensis]